MKSISIIIPVHSLYNENSFLGACLKSISSQTYPKNKMELVLIGDNCNVKYDLSSQGVKTIIYNFKRHVGLAKTRNKGISLSHGEFLAFIDADCVAYKNWLENLAIGFKNDDIGGCAGKILDLKNRCVNKEWVYGSEITLPFTGLSNAIFQRKVLEEVNFFDERFYMRCEDVDLSWRIYLKGYHIEYLSEAAVVHKGFPDIKECFAYGLGMRLLVNKYKDIFNLSHPFKLERYKKILMRSLKEGDIFFKIISNFIIFCGYIHGLLKENLHLTPKLEPVELTDRFLQPASSIKPLAVTINSKPLIKPNHIIWWKTESGLKILDLKEKREFELEDVSAIIWEYVIDEKPKDFIIDEIMNEYEVEAEEFKRNFEDFIEHLYKEKILILV